MENGCSGLLRVSFCTLRYQTPFLPQTVLGRAGRRDTDDRHRSSHRGRKPGNHVQAICDRLEAMRERTPRGRSNWQPSSVKMLLGRAGKLGLL